MFAVLAGRKILRKGDHGLSLSGPESKQSGSIDSGGPAGLFRSACRSLLLQSGADFSCLRLRPVPTRVRTAQHHKLAGIHFGLYPLQLRYLLFQFA